MLFVLTGDTQTGKTRWLQAAVRLLADRGVAAEGVLAPGVWRLRAGGGGDRTPCGGANAGRADIARYEKLGIDNVLLPEGAVVPFARRRDLARRDGVFCPESQSARAGLGWEISDAAIDRVNSHFSVLACRKGACVPAARGSDLGRSPCARHAGGVPAEPDARLLVVDELGRLELERDGGLTEAVSLLKRGPTARYPCALAVVRTALAARAAERFGGAWGAPVVVRPDAGGLDRLVSAFRSEEAG